MLSLLFKAVFHLFQRSEICVRYFQLTVWTGFLFFVCLLLHLSVCFDLYRTMGGCWFFMNAPHRRLKKPDSVHQRSMLHNLTHHCTRLAAAESSSLSVSVDFHIGCFLFKSHSSGSPAPSCSVFVCSCAQAEVATITDTTNVSAHRLNGIRQKSFTYAAFFARDDVQKVCQSSSHWES